MAIIIDPELSGGSVLLIRRVEREGDPWSGQVAFPGGRRGPNDKTLLDTAVREAWEEVGIGLREHELFGVLSLVPTRSGRIVIAPFVFRLKAKVAVRTNEEVAERIWVPLSELQTAPVSKTDVQVEEGRLVVDAYIIRGHVIWGLTFRIINQLLQREQTSDL